MSIKSWVCSETRKIFAGESTDLVPRSVLERANRKLLMLHAATELRDLTAIPGNRLEKLRGDRAGQFSMRVNDRYRICFDWRNSDAYNVEIVDHH